MAHGGRQVGDKVITQRKFQLFTKMRNACKSRKCSHDQIEKKKIAKGLNVSRSVMVCYFQRKLKITFHKYVKQYKQKCILGVCLRVFIFKFTFIQELFLSALIKSFKNEDCKTLN